MRGIVSLVIVSLFAAGFYYLSFATHHNSAPAAATNGLIAGLVSWGIGAVLTIIAMFAFRDPKSS